MKSSWTILAETDNWVAVNKPAGLLSVPDREQTEPSLKDLLQEKYGFVRTVHRLDKPTSGLILFARNETAHQYLSQLFEHRKIEKIYLGLVLGAPVKTSQTIDVPIQENPAKTATYITSAKGKPAQTSYQLLHSYGRYSWMRFELHTGRTHQIRVHLKHIGHPLAGDEIYGNGEPLLLSSIKGKKFKLSIDEESERPLLNRLALHAFQLKFKDSDGTDIALEAPLPKELNAALKQLEKWSK
jgi:23S rRNA pseudouridine955/2504/2580 synthase/23S rRNA pseudouridine1911/1915/1917 synthase